MLDARELSIKKLGFGLMRLPKIGEDIDVDQVSKMVDKFLEDGFTYFDTAFIYPGSEEATRKALVDRHDRKSYTLATKVNADCVSSEEEAKQEFFTSLERTNAGYIDYYLIHAVNIQNYYKYDKYHLWDFVKEQKEKGLIKHYGFSFHDSPELLEQVLKEHGDVDFVQLQLNYADWEDHEIQSRANYEIARKYNKPIVVMEPVKGGTLAVPPKPVQEILSKANPNVSYASWAIRFVASLEGVLTVLSGMSNVEQMEDNLSYMKDFKPLDKEEMNVIHKAQEALSKIDSIPCTSCKYCVKGCPKQIPIPTIFAARNKQLIWNQIDAAKEDYKLIIESNNSAKDCLKCGKCERVCPQKIHIIDKLKEADKFLS